MSAEPANHPERDFASFVRGRLAERVPALGLATLGAFLLYATTFRSLPMTTLELVAYTGITALLVPAGVLSMPTRRRLVVPAIAAVSIVIPAAFLWGNPDPSAFALARVVIAVAALAAIIPLPAVARDVQALAWAVVLLTAWATGAVSGAPGPTSLLTLTAACGLSWATSWLTVETWRRTWTDHADLTRLSGELARVSDDLRKAIQQTRTDLEVQHRTMMEQERLATLGRLAIGIGHEINNPLTVALTNVDLARHDLDPELLEDAKVALVRIKNIVVDLARIARPEQGEQDLAIHHLDGVFANALGVARMGLKSLQIEVSDVPAAAVRVRGRRSGCSNPRRPASSVRVSRSKGFRSRVR